MSFQGGLDSIDHLIVYDNLIHDRQKYINQPPIMDELRIQQETSSYNQYRNKHNLAFVGEQILMDGVPRYDYDFSAYNSRVIKPKATGKLGSYYYNGGYQESTEEIIQKELDNCLFNIKKTLRRNEAKAKGFEILEKERDPNRIENELYENVVFDDIYDKPNQNYRKVFYAPELNQQELIENNTGQDLNYDYDIEDFRRVQRVQEENIEVKLKKQDILNRLNQQLLIDREDEELEERERQFQLSKQKDKAGIMKRKGDKKVKKKLQFDDSIIDKNETDNDELDNIDAYGIQADGKVKMSFQDFIKVHKTGGKKTTQSTKNSNAGSSPSFTEFASDDEVRYDPTEMPKKIPRWKIQSQAIRASMKTNSGLTREENQQIVSALNRSELVYCECCKRKFKPGAAEQHIPICKEKFEEKQRQFQFQQKQRHNRSSSKTKI